MKFRISCIEGQCECFKEVILTLAGCKSVYRNTNIHVKYFLKSKINFLKVRRIIRGSIDISSLSVAACVCCFQGGKNQANLITNDRSWEHFSKSHILMGIAVQYGAYRIQGLKIDGGIYAVTQVKSDCRMICHVRFYRREKKKTKLDFCRLLALYMLILLTCINKSYCNFLSDWWYHGIFFFILLSYLFGTLPEPRTQVVGTQVLEA